MKFNRFHPVIFLKYQNLRKNSVVIVNKKYQLVFLQRKKKVYLSTINWYFLSSFNMENIFFNTFIINKKKIKNYQMIKYLRSQKKNILGAWLKFSKQFLNMDWFRKKKNWKLQLFYQFFKIHWWILIF